MMQDDILELMQRDLDDDLSVEEKARLIEHVQKDAGAQLVYNRLRIVSDELKSLPHVSPPFSIVDSILPQLVEHPAQPVAMATTSGTSRPLSILERKQQGTAPAAKRRIPLWVAKAGSGAAAACLLLGLYAIVQGVKGDRTQGASSEPRVQTTVVAPPKQSSKQQVDPPKTAQPPAKPVKEKEVATVQPLAKLSQSSKPPTNPPQQSKSFPDPKRTVDRSSGKKDDRELRDKSAVATALPIKGTRDKEPSSKPANVKQQGKDRGKSRARAAASNSGDDNQGDENDHKGDKKKEDKDKQQDRDKQKNNDQQKNNEKEQEKAQQEKNRKNGDSGVDQKTLNVEILQKQDMGIIEFDVYTR